jgi:alcohol dehydrogenase class IV
VGEQVEWREGERLIRFGAGVLADAPRLLGAEGFDPFALVTTPRAEAVAPGVVERADAVLHVQHGPVPEAAAAIRGEVAGRPLVALGGGRVIDSAKAVAGADGLRVAAIPTTLSGAEVTPFHRMPAGVEEVNWVRPALVVADPALMASAPLTKLAASAMNAMAHAMEALYTPAANPVNDAVALRAAALIGSGLGEDGERLALGGLLAGIASGNAGIAFHHAVCQTVVRVAGSPHAETNAVVLPHSARFAAPRAPEALASLAEALRTGDAPGRLAELTALCGSTHLADLGVAEEHLPQVVEALGDHRGLALTPGGRPSDDELLALLRAAL